MRQRRIIGVVLAVLAGLLVAGQSTPTAAATEVVQKVTYDGRTVTVRLKPIALRAPGFEVLVQQSDGSYDEVAAGPERGYLGSVDGVPGAIASAIRTSTGVLDGQVVFDRGAIWQFRDAAVYNTRGTTPPTSYQWPSASDAARNVSTAPGQAGATTYRWDLGFDLSSAWFTHAGTINSSVAKALDAVELSVVSLLDVYVPNAQLRPAVGRVVIRAATAHDPYAGNDSPLGTVRTEWRDHQADAGVDNAVLFNGSPSGGGVAYLSTAGTDWAASSNGGTGAPRAVLRHELGHNWGAHDNHTNGPEGATINSGNAYERFDGTELSAIFRYRDSRQASTAPFTPLGRFAPAVPPYAALDLVDDLTAGVKHSYRPLANDHDANGGVLALATVDSRSHLGGTLTRVGNVVTYRPPAVTETSVDWVEYRVSDASGRTATGVSLFRVRPTSALSAPAEWTRVTPPSGSVEAGNLQSGLLAGVATATEPIGLTVQRPRSGKFSTWKLVPAGTTFQLRSFSGRGCLSPSSSSASGERPNGVSVRPCSTGSLQRWRTIEHPRVGTALYNPYRRLCLVPKDGSMSAGAQLALAACGFSHASAWQVRSTG